MPGIDQTRQFVPLRIAVLTVSDTIGDDRLQRQARGYVVPDSFTHGSSEQRKRWFKIGFDQGTVQACNTFNAAQI